MFKPIRQTAYKMILGLFMASFIMVACNNKSEEKKTEDTTTKTMPDTSMTMPDTTKKADTAGKLEGKPVDEGDKP